MTTEGTFTLVVSLLVSALSGVVATLIGNRQKGKQDVEIANLKNRQDAQIETLRGELAAAQQHRQSELDYSLFERQERFKNLYNRRLEAIYELYPLAVDVRRAWGKLLSPRQPVGAPGLEERERSVTLACNSYRDKVWERQILFPESAVQTLEAMDNAMDRASELYWDGKRKGTTHDVMFAAVEKDIPRRLDGIHEAFRKLLGSDEEQVTQNQAVD
jgi:hypothetical protein